MLPNHARVLSLSLFLTYSHNISRMPLGPITPNMYVTNPCCPIVILSFAPAFLPIDRGLDQNPVNRLWVSHALANPVLSNAILLCAAVRVDFVYGRRQSMEALYYHGKT